MLKKILLSIILSFISVTGAFAADFNHNSWNNLLSQNVHWIRGGKASYVDYDGFARSRPALKAYIATTSALSQAQFNAMTRQQQLAFLINVYNAQTINLVLDGHNKIKSIKELRQGILSPWQRPIVSIFGQMRSLDYVEHNLIRGSKLYNDPRIHFALNCAAVSCPALRPEAYYGSKLDAQLEDQTRKFLSDRIRNRFYAGELGVSSIFKWYKSDFEAGFRGARSLAAFLSLYATDLELTAEEAASLKAGKMKITFLEYNWNLNSFATSKKIK